MNKRIFLQDIVSAITLVIDFNSQNILILFSTVLNLYKQSGLLLAKITHTHDHMLTVICPFCAVKTYFFVLLQSGETVLGIKPNTRYI